MMEQGVSDALYASTRERPYMHRHDVLSFTNCVCWYMIRAFLWIVVMEHVVSDSVLSISGGDPCTDRIVSLMHLCRVILCCPF